MIGHLVELSDPRLLIYVGELLHSLFNYEQPRQAKTLQYGMAFTIEPLLHDNIDEFITVWWESFAPEAADQVLPMIYLGGLTPALLARFNRRIMNETDGDTVEYCFCARDNATKKMVGISWWKGITKPSPSSSDKDVESEVEEQLSKKNAGPPIDGMDVALGDAFFRSILRAEASTIKAKRVPYICLNVLGVHPEFERQGAGGLLLEHGLARIDKLNVSTWLVASSRGRGLYSKHGFETLEELDFDATKYGGRSKGSHCIMLRPPQNK